MAPFPEEALEAIGADIREAGMPRAHALAAPFLDGQIRRRERG